MAMNEPDELPPRPSQWWAYVWLGLLVLGLALIAAGVL